jgi:hypothetical protein
VQVAHELINAGHRCLDVRLASPTYLFREVSLVVILPLSGSSSNARIRLLATYYGIAGECSI